jgi:hypothetical protein
MLVNDLVAETARSHTISNNANAKQGTEENGDANIGDPARECGDIKKRW